MPEKLEKNIGKSRRDFLKVALLAVAVLIFRKPINKVIDFIESREILNSFHNLVLIDIAPGRDQRGLKISQTFSDRDFLINIGLSEEQINKGFAKIAELAVKYGPNALKNQNSDAQRELIAFDEKFALAYGAYIRFDNHGVGVAQTIREMTEKNLNAGIDYIMLIAIQELFGKTSFELTTDELGNKKVVFTLSADNINQILTKYIKEGILNLSFLIGKMGFVYAEYGIGRLWAQVGFSKEPDGSILYFVAEKPENNGFVEYGEGAGSFMPEGSYSIRQLYQQVIDGELVELERADPLVEPSYLLGQKTTYQSYKSQMLTEAIYYKIPSKDLSIVELTRYFYSDGTPMIALKEEELIPFLETHLGVVKFHSPRVVLSESYTKSNAIDNLKELFKICRNNSKILICAAIGNDRADIRLAKQLLKKEWPENLLIIGEWDEENNSPAGNCYGSDIYVGLSSLTDEKRRGSSNATPIITAIAYQLWLRGYSIPEIKQTILKMCNKTTYQTDTQPEEGLLLNLEKVMI